MSNSIYMYLLICTPYSLKHLHVYYLFKEKEEIEKKVKKERRQKKIQRDLGKTASGAKYAFAITVNFNRNGEKKLT